MSVVSDPVAPSRQASSAPAAQASQSNLLMNRSTWIRTFLLVVALAACAAATGWFVDGFYAEDGSVLGAKGRYGDLAILVFMVPLGLVAIVLDRRDHPWARPVMLGLLAQLGFMHGLLAMDFHENAMFVVYSLMIGLCLLLGVTGLIDFAGSVEQREAGPKLRLASVVLLVAVLGGYGFWIIDVGNALLNDTTAESLNGTDLPANAARVIDMAIMLPLTALGAVKLWARRGDGLAISAVMSTYLILIGATVIVMEFGLANSNNLDLDVGKIAGFGFTMSLSLFAAAIIYQALGPGFRSNPRPAAATDAVTTGRSNNA